MAEERETVATDNGEYPFVMLKQYSVLFWYVVRSM